MTSCGYSCFVGGGCGPSSFNPANVQCIAIGDCKKDVRSHLVYCKISDDSGVDSETKLLLTRAGRFLAIANPSCRFNISFFLYTTFVDGNFNRLFPGIFEIEQSHLKMTVCPRHRDSFGTRWRCNRSRCTIPAEMAAHKGESSAPKAQCGLKKAHSAYVLQTTKMLVPIGSRTYFTLF